MKEEKEEGSLLHASQTEAKKGKPGASFEKKKRISTETLLKRQKK